MVVRHRCAALFSFSIALGTLLVGAIGCSSTPSRSSRSLAAEAAPGARTSPGDVGSGAMRAAYESDPDGVARLARDAAPALAVEVAVADAAIVEAAEIDRTRASAARTFVSIDTVAAWRAAGESVVLVDVRDADAWAKGHLPGAVHLPWDRIWAPPLAGGAPGGPFLDERGALDVDRYVAYLGEAGLTAEDRLCFYGASGGPADPAVAATILDLLGHAHVHVLAGIATDQWVESGRSLSNGHEHEHEHEHELEEATRGAARYEPREPRPKAVLSTEDLLVRLSRSAPVLLDARPKIAYDGEFVGGHAYGGRIPGAIHFPARLLPGGPGSASFASTSLESLSGLLHEVDPTDAIVVYGEGVADAARAYLALRDLDVPTRLLYAAGWRAWGNRHDTPIDERTLPPL